MKTVQCAMLFLGISCCFFIKSVPDIHVFGDSHALFCFCEQEKETFSYPYSDIGSIPFFIHHLGSKTMYGFSKKKWFNIRDYHVCENNVAVFVLGEIDVRCHIAWQRDEKKRDLDEIISSLVNNYINVILENKASYRNLYCVVTEVMPPTNHLHYSSEFPVRGTLQDRVLITFYLNEKLRQACLENGIYFLPIDDFVAQSDGTLSPLYADWHHMNKNYNYLVKDRLLFILHEEKII
jgi:hypothetical protein